MRETLNRMPATNKKIYALTKIFEERPDLPLEIEKLKQDVVNLQVEAKHTNLFDGSYANQYYKEAMERKARINHTRGL